MKAQDIYKLIIGTFGLFGICQGATYVAKGLLFVGGFNDVPASLAGYYVSYGVIEIALAFVLIKVAPVLIRSLMPE